MEAREPAPLEVIPAYIKRQDVNSLPAEVASKSPDGNIVPYSRRDFEELEARQDTNNLPAEVASKAPDGNIVLFENKAAKQKRAPAINTMPVDVPTMAPDGNIVLFENKGN